MAHKTTPANLATKSIDVGSMFLIDLSVNESELTNSSDLGSAITLDSDPVFPIMSQATTYQRQLTNDGNIKSVYANTISFNNDQSKLTGLMPMTQSIANSNNKNHRQEHEDQLNDYLGNSLDRLASVIEGDDKQFRNKNHHHHRENHGTHHGCNQSQAKRRHLSSITVAEPQPPPEIVETLDLSPPLSDESFVSSSGGSSADSLDASFSGSSSAAGDEREEMTSDELAIREDSGVLDMKDLDGQLDNHSMFDDINERKTERGKQISSKTIATNLINMSVKNHGSSKHPNFRPNRPTNTSHHYHNHYHGDSSNHSSHQSRRSVSASLPIQVPVRQMKKDLNKLKLGLIGERLETIPSDAVVRHHNPATASSNISTNQQAKDEFDEFLEQEYNENHHNHYPIDEHDDEHLRADENPMRLFESIQALARSLHEDAELFGSLPPKRMLESPIRSLALV